MMSKTIKIQFILYFVLLIVAPVCFACAVCSFDDVLFYMKTYYKNLFFIIVAILFIKDLRGDYS